MINAGKICHHSRNKLNQDTSKQKFANSCIIRTNQSYQRGAGQCFTVKQTITVQMIRNEVNTKHLDKTALQFIPIKRQLGPSFTQIHFSISHMTEQLFLNIQTASCDSTQFTLSALLSVRSRCAKSFWVVLERCCQTKLIHRYENVLSIGISRGPWHRQVNIYLDIEHFQLSCT